MEANTTGQIQVRRGSELPLRAMHMFRREPKLRKRSLDISPVDRRSLVCLVGSIEERADSSQGPLCSPETLAVARVRVRERDQPPLQQLQQVRHASFPLT